MEELYIAAGADPEKHTRFGPSTGGSTELPLVKL
jgi:hypothetical protein